MDSYAKRKIWLRGWLHASQWWSALAAMDFAEKFHTGTRKDGVTPEFSHQVDIAHHIRTLPCLMFPEPTICVAFLHDVREDYDVSDEEIRVRFGDAVADSTERMSKVIRGVKKDPDVYFARIAECAISSVAKGSDRVLNLGSMVGVFKPEKQAEYADEGETRFLPMLKRAARTFPKQEAAYQNIRLTMTTQIRTVRAGPPNLIRASVPGDAVAV